MGAGLGLTGSDLELRHGRSAVISASEKASISKTRPQDVYLSCPAFIGLSQG